MKKNYIKPNSLLIQMSTAPMMAALSGNLDETPYNGTAGARGFNFAFAFEEEALPEDPTQKKEEDWDDEEEDL